MAELNTGSFERALNTFKQSLSPALAEQFSICTLEDVKNAVRSIQQKEGESQDGRLRSMVRLRAFIEAMEEFGKVIEIFVNAHEFVCFIWGPIKFVLNIARSHLDSFDKLLDAYSRIGDAIPGLLAYKATFERHPSLAAVLEDYYSDILRFHQESLAVFNRSKWKNFLHATWKTFDSRFDPILQSLASRRELLESEKISASLHEIQSVRDKIETVYKEQTRQAAEINLNKHESKIARIKQRLRVSDYQIDQTIPTNVKHRHGNESGQWIFRNAEFLSWSDRSSVGHEVLYVNGIPGAGKTTLISTIIEKFHEEMQAEGSKNLCVVAYFYFKHGQEDKNNHNGFLRAILAQLLDRDIFVSEQLYNDLWSATEESLRSTKTLEARIKDAFEGHQAIFLILDGLDACDREEAEHTVDWLLTLVNGDLETSNCRLRILFSGQRDGVLDKMLVNQPSITLESSEEHLEDISRYCQMFVAGNKRKAKFSLSRELECMFLYARIVLENLLRQTSIGRLKQELRRETFPRGLEAAYERVISRIVDESSEGEREDAMTVLSMVLCAKRLLRWREIQAFFCIKPEDSEVDYDKFLQVDYKELCGALLDGHQVENGTQVSEDMIQIVHETARRYICDRKLVDIYHENAKVSIFCTQYLSSRPFCPWVGSDDIFAYAQNCYYSFQDYAVQYWFEHLRQCVESSNVIDPALFERSIDSAKRFLDIHCLETMDDQNGTATRLQVIERIKRLPEDGRGRNINFDFELSTVLIRRQIAKLGEENLASETMEMLVNLYGRLGKYKCPKPWCELFKGDLGTAEELKDHTNRHELPFHCPSEGCFAAKLGFSSKSNLEHHIKHHHVENTNQLHFPRIQGKREINIFSAAAKGDLEAVEEALDSGEDVNQKIKPGGSQTPLFLAARNGHVQVCKLLLLRGANPAIRGSGSGSAKLTALDAAVNARRVEVVGLLMEYWPSDLSIESTARLAAHRGDLDVIRVFLDANLHREFGRKFTFEGVLLEAIRSGNVALVQYLIENGLEQQADELCLNVALATPAASPILRLLLSTGRLTITRLQEIGKCIDDSQLSLAKMLTSYPNISLDILTLQAGLRKAESKEGFGEVADALRALLDTATAPPQGPVLSANQNDSVSMDDFSMVDLGDGVQYVNVKIRT